MERVPSRLELAWNLNLGKQMDSRLINLAFQVNGRLEESRYSILITENQMPEIIFWIVCLIWGATKDRSLDVGTATNILAVKQIKKKATIYPQFLSVEQMDILMGPRQ